VRTVDLALYADMLAGEAATIAARLEGARSQLQLARIEAAARTELRAESVARLEALGFLTTRADREVVREHERSLAALEELQAWVESWLSRSAA
jgi:putative SOS response-associated peptidase YedK